MNQILELIKRTAVNPNLKEVIIPLHKSLVRSHLDYYEQACRPHLNKVVELIERGQRRTTRLFDKCRGIEFDGRLNKIELTTMAMKAITGDMLEVNLESWRYLKL